MVLQIFSTKNPDTRLARLGIGKNQEKADLPKACNCRTPPPPFSSHFWRWRRAQRHGLSDKAQLQASGKIHKTAGYLSTV